MSISAPAARSLPYICGDNCHDQKIFYFVLFLAIESFVSHCRKLIQNGPILLRQIEQVHSEAIQLSETIQSLGSGKSTYAHIYVELCLIIPSIFAMRR